MILVSRQIVGFVVIFIVGFVNRAVKFNIVFQIIVNVVQIVLGCQLFGNFLQIVNGIFVIFKSDSLGIIAIHHFQVNNIAQLHGTGQKLVTPAGNRLNRHRALAQTVNHNRFAGLNTLGNGNFSVAGQQLDRPHFLKIHPHRVIIAPQLFLVKIAALIKLFFLFNHIGLKRVNLRFGNNADAHVGNAGHNVLNIFRRFAFGRQSLVEFFNRNITADFAFINKSFNGTAQGVNQRGVTTCSIIQVLIFNV